MKKILFNEEARVALKKGVDDLANAVKVTLGPSGKNVILAAEGYPPFITKDGVSVANHVTSDDIYENLGATLIKEVAQQTNKKVGDGTTTATVLAQKILDVGFKRIEEGENPMNISNELKSNLSAILEKLKENATPIENNEQIRDVASIATNNDILLSDIIFECYTQVKDSIIFDLSKSNETYYEIVKGMRFRSSYISTYFINNAEDASVTFDKEGIVFIFDGKIENLKQISKVLYQAEKLSKPLVIIAEDVDNNTLMNLVKHTKTGKLPCVVIQSPGFGFGRQKTLEDISIYTGGTIYNNKTDLTNVEFGKFDSVTIDEEFTCFRGIHGKQEDIANRVVELELSKKDKTPAEVSKLNERIAKFKNGIGVIYIGAESELEMKERRDRLEDAINAVKAANEEGIVAGGGATLKFISHWNRDNIYHEILSEPYKQILRNQGISIDTDSEENTMEDYIAKGIVDPVKVTRTALENAVSVASTILTTEAIVIA